MLPNLWQLAPGQRAPVFGGHSPAPSVGFAFDPLDLDPPIALSLDATNVQTEGGGQAGYLDPVAGISNPGTASDPAQGTSLAQPIYLPHTGRNYLHLPGITGNTLTVPLTADTYDYVVTYVDGTTASGTLTSDGTLTVGPSQADFERKQIWKLSISLSGSEVAEFLADGVSHHGTAYTDQYANDWTVNQSGDNPAAIIGKPVIRTDGVEQFLSGTFASAINGGRMFALFTVLGGGGGNASRVFTTIGSSGGDTGELGCIWSYNEGPGDLVTYYNGTNRLRHVGGFDGRFVHEVGINGTDNFSLRNNTDEQTNSVDTSAIASTEFFIGARSDGSRLCPIDLEPLHLHRPDITDADAENMRKWIQDNHSIELGI